MLCFTGFWVVFLPLRDKKKNYAQILFCFVVLRNNLPNAFFSFWPLRFLFNMLFRLMFQYVGNFILMRGKEKWYLTICLLLIRNNYLLILLMCSRKVYKLLLYPCIVCFDSTFTNSIKKLLVLSLKKGMKIAQF